MIGLGVGAAGLAAYYLYRRSEEQEELRARAAVGYPPPELGALRAGDYRGGFGAVYMRPSGRGVGTIYMRPNRGVGQVYMRPSRAQVGGARTIHIGRGAGPGLFVRAYGR